jgi:hypothetical protein
MNALNGVWHYRVDFCASGFASSAMSAIDRVGLDVEADGFRCNVGRRTEFRAIRVCTKLLWHYKRIFGFGEDGLRTMRTALIDLFMVRENRPDLNLDHQPAR